MNKKSRKTVAIIPKTPATGEITITRYLSGQMPSKEYSDVIKKALSSPNYMIKLMNENKEKMGKTAYNKAINNILYIRTDEGSDTTGSTENFIFYSGDLYGSV